MDLIESKRIEEIKKLHFEIMGNLKISLQNAIKIGELLVEQKKSMRHGEFIPWIEKNLPFSDRTARNYMRLFREKDRLKTETVSDLKEAYNLLIEHKKDVVTMLREILDLQLKSESEKWANKELNLKIHNLIQLYHPEILSGIKNIDDVPQALETRSLALQIAQLHSEYLIHLESELGKAFIETGIPL